MANGSSDFLTWLKLDVIRTLGEQYRQLVSDAAKNVATLEMSDSGCKVVENLQQRVQDERIDTTWPACHRHPNHPLSYEAGWWRCARDGVQIAPVGALRTGVRPEFPIRVSFHQDDDQWVLASLDELACSLEWFDSNDPDEFASVVDSRDRAVRVKVERLALLRFELLDR